MHGYNPPRPFREPEIAPKKVSEQLSQKETLSLECRIENKYLK